jgi:hypothetical protein
VNVALFVEGSSAGVPRSAQSWLERIWNSDLATALRLPPFDLIVPISKRDVVALDRGLPRPPGCEPLDAKMMRLGAGRTFDAAVVAWDLYPAWNGLDSFCRWRETLKLYEHLSESSLLPRQWRESAATRFSEMRSRNEPSARISPPTLRPGSVLPLCMDPEFEGLLTADESGLKRVLGISGRPDGWPRRWNQAGMRQPGDRLLGPAVDSLPRSHWARRQIRGRWRQRKNDWGELVLRSLLADEDAAQILLTHPVCQRLREIVP